MAAEDHWTWQQFWLFLKAQPPEQQRLNAWRIERELLKFESTPPLEQLQIVEYAPESVIRSLKRRRLLHASVIEELNARKQKLQEVSHGRKKKNIRTIGRIQRTY